MEDLDRLTAELASKDDLIEFVAVLLRFCRDHEREVRAADDDQACAAAGARARAGAIGVFRAITRRHPSRIALDNIIGLLRSSAAAMGTALAAREVAGAFDDILGPRVFDWFRAAGGAIMLRDGDPFPVVAHPVKRIFGDDLNSRPERHSPHVSALPHLRIAPPLGPFDVVLSFEHADLFRALDRGDRIGVGIPWASDQDHDRDACGSAEQPRFFNVRPRQSLEQGVVLGRVLDAAEAEAISVLVLPELCIDAYGQEVVERWCQRPARKLDVLAAGSRHLEEAGVRRNRATVFVRNAPPFTHDKFTPFIMRKGETEVREDIATAPARITIHYSEGWSVVVLVCKDLLDERVAPLLEQLRVRLVLVPAFSERTAPFRARLEELACGAQAIVVVANTPASDDCDAMVIALPLEHSSVRTVPAPVAPETVRWVELLGGG